MDEIAEPTPEAINKTLSIVGMVLAIFFANIQKNRKIKILQRAAPENCSEYSIS